MPLKYFDGTNHGEVLSRVTNDVDTVNQTLNQSLTQIITSVVTVVGVLAMMFSISWVMTLVALLIVPLSLAFVTVVISRSQRYFRQQQDDLGHVNGHVEEVYGGHLVMKPFTGEDKSLAQFATDNNSLWPAWKSQFLCGLMMPIMGFIGNLGYVAVCVLAPGWRPQRHYRGRYPGLYPVRALLHPAHHAARQHLDILQQTAAAAERVFEFLDEPEEIAEAAQPVELPAVRGEVEFDHVHFGYDPDKIVINDFSATARPGQKIAIVGPTGAGKPTMVKLLMRFYDVNSGAIRVDGHDIREFSRHDLRSNFAMVLQDAWLYNGTIMENIRYGRADATDEEVIAAAVAAHADPFIRTLPGGYDMEINEEVTNVSQGQMQLLTIARAILADPRVLILDEATSSVDTRTEVLIQRAMDRLMETAPALSSPTLSTIRNADLILVMNEGDIVEQGRHEELLARGGFYATLYNSQFQNGDAPATAAATAGPATAALGLAGA
jgi:ATP-binding cassette subfamily B protein